MIVIQKLQDISLFVRDTLIKRDRRDEWNISSIHARELN